MGVRKKGEERMIFQESSIKDNILQKIIKYFLPSFLPIFLLKNFFKEYNNKYIIIKFYIRTSKNNMQEPRRQSKRIAESGTGGVLETVKVLLPKTRRAPVAAKKPASTVKIFH